MEKDINKILTKKINECGGDMKKLHEELSEYFNVPLEDIQTNIRITIPVSKEIIEKDNDTINVNLSLKAKDEEPEYIHEEFCLDEEFEEVRQEGIFEGKLEVGKKLYDEGIMGLEEISKITELSIDDLVGV